MDDYLANRARLNQLIDKAQRELDIGKYAAVVQTLAEGTKMAWHDYAGVFLDRRVEALVATLAEYVNTRYPMLEQPEGSVGLLMSSIHATGGHSKIAWRWMQIDEQSQFNLVLTEQGGSPIPEQLVELIDTGRVRCSIMNAEQSWLELVCRVRDELAVCNMLVVNIHPNDVVGAIVAACLCKHAKIIFINHAYYSYSVGMTFSHALACTTPASVDIALRERLISPEHIVWYRNSPEWDAQQVTVDHKTLRAKLGVPEDAVLILSTGTEYKYYPQGDLNLFSLVAPSLEASSDAYLVVLGVQAHKMGFARETLEHFGQRIILLPSLKEREWLQVVAGCDIYLESVPQHSGGGSQQAMLLGKPVINFADPHVYRAHLGPQLFSVDDFCWFHFSVDAYRHDLDALIGSAALRQSRGAFLQRQVASRISTADNYESIKACYAKAACAPLIGSTLTDPSEYVEDPVMLQAYYEHAQSLAAFFSSVASPGAGRKEQALPSLRAIAFHLPQYHRIAENDRWWGEGFTEWDNVRQGRPLFDGHYQPRVPGELGYYDLLDISALERQAALAREYGLEGFCFYHYWFGGKRLLEKPVDQLLQHPEIDLPFCLCWANENWTRSWDGGVQDVLMAQDYSPALNERFARDLVPYMSDPRYIRIAGKPVLLIYRTEIIPDLQRTVATWRDVWRQSGVGEVYLVAIESFQVIDPERHGFDAACEFLPHQVNFQQVLPEQPISSDKDPALRVGDYKRLAESWLARPPVHYKRFRCVVPSWDNAARRRKGGATLFHGASPELYEQWLRKTAELTLHAFKGQECLLFINAWNEWGEGSYLEPDQRYGRAYLEATQRALAFDALHASAKTSQANGSNEVEGWLSSRVLTSVQKELKKAYLASRVPCSIGVVIVDGAEQPESVAQTLASLRDDDGQYALRPLLISLARQAPEGYAGTFVSAPPEQMVEVLSRVLQDADVDWFMCVSAGDRFTPSGLHMLQVELSNDVPCVAIFGDELLLGEGGWGAMFRPDFNLDLLLSLPSAMSRHWLFKTQTFNDLGGFNADFPGAYEFEYIVRLIEQVGIGCIGHLSEPILISTPAPLQNVNDEVRVLERHLQQRNYPQGQVVAELAGRYHLTYGHANQPLVSIIIPTKDQLPILQRCVESLLERTAYANYELLIVDNNSETPEALAWFEGVEELGDSKVRILRYPHPFNYSAINNMAAHEARGEYLVLLNNDTAIISERWLDELLNHAQRPEVGIVGAKLLYPDGRIQHAGVVLGLRGPADHPFIGEPLDAPGYMQRLQVDQNYSAVTAACLMIRKSLYEDVGGLDEERFKVSYNDVDLCLKVRESGHLIVWTPHAVVMHEGSVSQQRIDPQAAQAKRQRFIGEQDAMYEKWLPQLARDPAYNRNLSLNGRGFALESDSNLTWRPLTWRPLPVLLAHPADPWGCGNYRVVKPLQAMRREGLVDGMLSEGLLQVVDLERYDPEVIVLQRQIGDERLEAMRRIQRLSRAFTVYELDDYLPNLPMKSVHREHMPRDILRSLRQGLGFVDRFVVSTEPLAEAFVGLHDDIRVIENRLPVEWWKGLASQRRRGRKPRVGWAGGVSHTGDLELIADVVKELATEVEWVFLGMCPQGIRPYVHEFHEGVTIELYPAALARLDLDLALAPIEQNLFNECKSNLRLLEYGACGFPVVCSDLRPYQSDLPVTRVKNRFKDWVDAIRMHINDLDATARMGDELRAKVLSDWMLEGDNLLRWRAAWLPD